MDDRHQFLRAEIDSAAKTMLANEDMGDRRVNTLLTIAGAAGVVFGLAVDAEAVEGTGLLWTGAAAFGAVTLVGLLTLVRIMYRNLVTTDLINGLNRARVAMVRTYPELVELLPFTPRTKEEVRKRGSIFSVGRGGHLETVSLINSLTASAAVGAAAVAVSDSSRLWILAIPTVPIVWAFQMITANRVYVSGKKFLDDQRATAVGDWQATPPYYRAGVGLVVSRADGYLLTYLRSDSPDGTRQLPQGGIEPGESVRTAALRELKEETGLGEQDVQEVEISPFLTVYELPIQYQSPKTGFGQAHRWVHYRLLNDEPSQLIGTSSELSQPEWMDPADLPANAVMFRKSVYIEVVGWLQQSPPVV